MNSTAFVRPRHVRLAALAALLALPLACGDRGGGSEREIEFRGEQPFLPDFDYDSGWLPAGSPVTVRATVTAGGGITVLARASSDGDTLTPVAGSGTLEVAGSLAMEISASIDTMGVEYEGVVESFEYAIAPASATFEPFALDAGVTATSMLPAAEIAAVPIPSLPGATLVLEVTGGEITTTFAGTCAEAANGFGEYAGTLTTEGTVATAATVEIEIPIVGTQSFGPFAIDIPIPAIASSLDLGTRALDSGEPAVAMGICDGSGTGEETGAGTGAEAEGSSESGPMGTTIMPGTTEATTADSSGSSSSSSGADESSTGGTNGDPDYPSPYPNGCPADHVGVTIDDGTDNGVCLPPCNGDSTCPPGATGNAYATCDFNPGSSIAACTDASTCGDGEECVNGYCMLPPTHCVLYCNDEFHCPDEMQCTLGACTYAG